MTSPHPTVTDLTTACERYDRETTRGVIATPRYRLRYASWGNGPPIVFIHGMSDCARSFAMVMIHLVDAGYRCIGYELADGKGDGAILGTYKHPHFADDLIALLDHWQFPTVDLIGSSFGSTIALRALLMYPDRVRRVVLKGGFARRPLSRLERGLCRLGRFWPWRMEDLILRETVMAKFEGHQFVGCPPEIFRFLLGNNGLTPCKAAAHRSLIINQLDFRPQLPSIRHPVRMIGGNIDAIVPREFEADLEAGIPDCRRVEFAPCGHYPQYTMPGPTAAAIREFLR